MAQEKESNDIMKKAPKDRPTRRAFAATHVTVYANNADVQLSPWDFRIRLGHVEKADDSELVIEDVATIFMSPAHTKAFLEALIANVAKYEKFFGKIEDPREKFKTTAGKES
jgi:hypothetical protein